MKLKDISLNDVRQLMGANATRREASMMRDILRQHEDRYSETTEIPEYLWNQMACLARDHAGSC